MSRVEQILNGTYTGRPLSRVEELLMNGAAGGGGTDVSGIIQDISDLQTDVSRLRDDMTKTNTSVSKLVTHALTDAPLTSNDE